MSTLSTNNTGYIYLDNNPMPRVNATQNGNDPVFDQLSNSLFPGESFVLQRIDTVPLSTLLFTITLVRDATGTFLQIQDTEVATNKISIPIGERYINMINY